MLHNALPLLSCPIETFHHGSYKYDLEHWRIKKDLMAKAFLYSPHLINLEIACRWVHLKEKQRTRFKSSCVQLTLKLVPVNTLYCNNNIIKLIFRNCPKRINIILIFLLRTFLLKQANCPMIIGEKSDSFIVYWRAVASGWVSDRQLWMMTPQHAKYMYK